MTDVVPTSRLKQLQTTLARLNARLSFDFCPSYNPYVYWLKNPFWLLLLAAAGAALCGAFVNTLAFLLCGILLDSKQIYMSAKLLIKWHIHQMQKRNGAEYEYGIDKIEPAVISGLPAYKRQENCQYHRQSQVSGNYSVQSPAYPECLNIFHCIVK